MAKAKAKKSKTKKKAKVKAKAKTKAKAKPKVKKTAKKGTKKGGQKSKKKPAKSSKAKTSTAKKSAKKASKKGTKKSGKKQDSALPKLTPAREEIQNALAELPDLGPIKIGGEKALSFPMKTLEKHFTEIKTEQEKNRAEYAVTCTLMERNGNWQELGYENASRYFEGKHGISFSTIKAHINALRLLTNVAEMKAKDIPNAFVQYSHSRLAAVYGYAVKVHPTEKELMADLSRCERDSELGNKEFRNYLKEKYGARLAAAKDEELAQLSEAERPVKIPSFAVPKSLADNIMEAQNVAITLTKNGELPFGEAIAMACSEFVSQHGAGFTSLQKVLNAIALRHSVMPLLIKNPDATTEQERELKDVPQLMAFEYDGNYVMHTTRAKAAKALGVKADEVRQVRINIIPALEELYGWSEDKAVQPLPKNIEDMSDADVLESINQLKKDMNLNREMMTALASGRSSRALLNHLLAVKAKGGFTEAELEELLSDTEPPEDEEDLGPGKELDDGFPEDDDDEEVIDVEAEVKEKPKAKKKGKKAKAKPKTKAKGKKAKAKKKPAAKKGKGKKKAKAKVKVKPKRKKAAASA